MLYAIVFFLGFYFEKRVAVLRRQRDRVGKTQLRFMRAEAAEGRVHKQPAALAPDLARLGEKPNGAKERGERGFGTEKEVTKEDPRRPEPTDGAEFGDGARAEGESGLPIAETSLDGVRKGRKARTSWSVRSRASFHEEEEVETAYWRSVAALERSPRASRRRAVSWKSGSNEAGA